MPQRGGFQAKLRLQARSILLKDARLGLEGVSLGHVTPRRDGGLPSSSRPAFRASSPTVRPPSFLRPMESKAQRPLLFTRQREKPAGIKPSLGEHPSAGAIAGEFRSDKMLTTAPGSGREGVRSEAWERSLVFYTVSTAYNANHLYS
jgi:hypothetical protein